MRFQLPLMLLLLATVLQAVGVKATPAVPVPVVTPAVQSKDQVVYITRAGKRYHRPTCRYAKIPSTLSEAQKCCLTPCQVCNPP